MTQGKVTTHRIRQMKGKEPIAVITAYDYPSAKLAESAGADVILVGDSLGMVVLGYESTVQVTIDEMLHHTKAVARACSRSMVVADMPFLSYHADRKETLANAGKLMQQGLATAIKMEGGREIVPMVEACVQAGIPVMGHLGLTPQSVHQLGGYRVQGREIDTARKIIEDARALEKAGVFAIVLEVVPEPLAERISKELLVPTIGIGAGRSCDGQVLVFHDLLQYASPVHAKFVKTYANLGEQIEGAISNYVQDVKLARFPEAGHVFGADEALIKGLQDLKEAPSSCESSERLPN